MVENIWVIIARKADMGLKTVYEEKKAPQPDNSKLVQKAIV